MGLDNRWQPGIFQKPKTSQVEENCRLVNRQVSDGAESLTKMATGVAVNTDSTAVADAVVALKQFGNNVHSIMSGKSRTAEAEISHEAEGSTFHHGW